MTGMPSPIEGAKAVAISWHGVLFDRGRMAIHAAMHDTFANWGVEVTRDELVVTRGPTGRPQIERLLSLPRIAEAFRAHHGRWAATTDLEAMGRDLEPRLIAAATAAREPNQDACEMLRSLHRRGVRTAVICCTPRRLLGPQLAALEGAGLPIDCLVTADEACAPAPEPWGIFEAMQRLGIDDAASLALVDDSPAGSEAARNAGAIGISLATPGAAPSTSARASVRTLDELVS